MEPTGEPKREKNIAGSTEFLCPACGAVLAVERRTEVGWNCSCGDFIPDALAINPYQGCSNQHKQNCFWR